MKRVYIYALRDPRTDECFYVGQTINPKRRLTAHLSLSNSKGWADYPKALSNRIQAIRSSGNTPRMEILEEVIPPSVPDSRERHWIQTMGMVHPILNQAPPFREPSTFAEDLARAAEFQRIGREAREKGL